MKYFSLALLLGFTLNTFAVPEERPGSEDRECRKKIRSLNCGSPVDEKAFITCVDLRADELSDRCETYLVNEIERIKNGY